MLLSGVSSSVTSIAPNFISILRPAATRLQRTPAQDADCRAPAVLFHNVAADAVARRAAHRALAVNEEDEIHLGYELDSTIIMEWRTPP